MGRLIDADTVMVYLPFTQLYLNEYLKNVPTVEAISKADYEKRLKADMVAILAILDKYDDTDLIKVKYVRQAIQEKINALKEERNGIHET